MSAVSQPRRSADQYDQGQHQRREPPNNIEVEQALLGAILVNNQALFAVSAFIKPVHFYEPLHRKIFEVASYIIDMGRSANPVTIKTHLPADSKVGDLTVAQYLARLASEAVSIINAEDYGRQIYDLAVRRALISIGEDAVFTAYDSPIDMPASSQLNDLRQRLDEVQDQLIESDGIGVSGASAMDAAIRHTESSVQGTDDSAVDFRHEPTRQLIGRAHPGQLIIIGGGTKQGKSAFARQIAIQAARNGSAILDYSGEMDAIDLGRRELARISRVSASRQMEGDLSRHEILKLEAAKQELDRLRWSIIDRRRTVEQLCQEYEVFAKRHASPVLVVDSVTLFDVDRYTRGMSKFEFAEYATDRLKALARKTKSVVIALAQLKKNTFAVEKQFGKSPTVKTYRNVVARRPRASDLYGACERDADHVIIPYRPLPILEEIEPAEGSDEHLFWEEVMEEFRNSAELILALSRHRTPGRRKVRWDGETTSFLPLTNDNQERFQL